MNTTKTTEAARHTPGPWITTYWSDRDEICISTEENGGGEWLADVKPLIDDDGQTQQSSNARLIAAAPCLLKACHDLLNCAGLNLVEQLPGDLQAIERANAAIAKARGQ